MYSAALSDTHPVRHPCSCRCVWQHKYFRDKAFDAPVTPGFFVHVFFMVSLYWCVPRTTCLLFPVVVVSPGLLSSCSPVV